MPSIKTLILAFPFLFLSPDKPSWYLEDPRQDQIEELFQHAGLADEITVDDMQLMLTFFVDAQRWRQFRRLTDAFNKVNQDERLSWKEVGEEMDKFEAWALKESAENEAKAKRDAEKVETKNINLGVEL